MWNILHRNNNNGNLMTQQNVMVAITEDGKKALDSMIVTGNAYPIMLALDYCGSMSINNIAREARIDSQVAEREVRKLKNQGYVAIRNFQKEG